MKKCCGPPVVLAPGAAPSIEAVTDEAGRATRGNRREGPLARHQSYPRPGLPTARSTAQRLYGREGSVLVTWTAPSLGIRQMGPATALIGETITYRIQVSNPGDSLARNVVASEDSAHGSNFLQANPVPVVDGRRLQWRLGDLAPRQRQIIEATFRTTRTRRSRPLRRGSRRRRASIEPLCKHCGSGRGARPGEIAYPAAGHAHPPGARRSSHAGPDASSISALELRLCGDTPG